MAHFVPATNQLVGYSDSGDNDEIDDIDDDVVVVKGIYAVHLVSSDRREVVVKDQPGFRLWSHRAQRGERQGQRRPSNFPPVTSLLACIGRWKRNIKISVSVEVFLALCGL